MDTNAQNTTVLHRYVYGPGSDEVLVQYDGSGRIRTMLRRFALAHPALLSAIYFICLLFGVVAASNGIASEPPKTGLLVIGNLAFLAGGLLWPWALNKSMERRVTSSSKIDKWDIFSALAVLFSCYLSFNYPDIVANEDTTTSTLNIILILFSLIFFMLISRLLLIISHYLVTKNNKKSPLWYIFYFLLIANWPITIFFIHEQIDDALSS